jgi:hypothetical protein
MADQALSPSVDNQAPSSQIQQNLKGNDNQAIVEMKGGNAIGNVTGHVDIPTTNNYYIFSSDGTPQFEISAKSSEREIPASLAYLADREEQEEELEKALQKHHYEASINPFICIVHGNKFQSHEEFLNRLHQRSLPRLIGQNVEQISIRKFVLNLNFRKMNVGDLESRCCKNLASQVLNNQSATLQEINQAICQQPYPVMISMHLLTEDWQNQGFIILDKILQFWQNWPDLHPGKKLIIFLSIRYQNYEYGKHTSVFSIIFIFLKNFWRSHHCRKANRKMRDQLQKFSMSHFQQFSRISCTVLPELMGISEGQAANWARDEVKPIFGEDVSGYLIEKIEKIYQDLDKMPMSKLADELKNLLKTTTI